MRFSRVLRAASAAGIKLFITPGVLEEVERHINLNYTYVDMKEGWKGHVPFLYASYVVSGGNPMSFKGWLSTFCGQVRPLDDVAEFLQDEFNIAVIDLESEVKQADEELVRAATDVWINIHDARRKGEAEDYVKVRLARHDAELYVGVMQRRKADVGKNPLGFSHWIITLDSSAREAHQSISDELVGVQALYSPFISTDFLIKYIAYGPGRNLVAPDERKYLPALLGAHLETYTKEIIEVAENVRRLGADLTDRQLRRRIRDEVDKARAHIGPIQKAGIEGAMENIRNSRRNVPR